MLLQPSGRIAFSSAAPAIVALSKRKGRVWPFLFPSYRKPLPPQSAGARTLQDQRVAGRLEFDQGFETKPRRRCGSRMSDFPEPTDTAGLPEKRALSSVFRNAR